MANAICALNALIGNDALRARLGADLQENKLSHAYLIEGASGSGKRTLARQLCAALACTERTGDRLPCGRCLACRKVLEGNCPDVRIIRPREDRTTIGVDDIRFVRADVLVEPNDLNHKIYIIEQADTMTEQAQNALLLTLEEPPSYVVFLLLCERSEKMLETIRSRAPRLRMQPLSMDVVRAYLKETERAFVALPAEEQDAILMIANGSIGRAKELLDARARKPILARRALSERLVDYFLGRRSGDELQVLTKALEGERGEFLSVLGDARTALRDLILLKRAEEAPLCFYADCEKAMALSDCVTMNQLFDCCERIERGCEQLQRNANLRLVTAMLLL